MGSYIEIPHLHGVSSLDLTQFTPAEREEIFFAFRFAQRVHEGQYRKTGEPFITHPVEVANILLNELGPELGTPVTKDEVIAALIHDSVEDSDLDITAIKVLFGTTAAHLTNLLTKKELYLYINQSERKIYDLLGPSEKKEYISRVKAVIKPRQLSDYYSGILSDPRAIHIKLADKKHNYKTLHLMGETKKAEEFEETKKYFSNAVYLFNN